jgi:sortase A
VLVSSLFAEPGGVPRKWLALVGELLIIGAAGIGLFVLYQLWFTNLTSDGLANSLSVEVQRDYQDRTALTPKEAVAIAATEEDSLATLGLLYIPRLANDVWALPIVAGVTPRHLAVGVGHYPSAALPGEVGNFAIAGHRATYGEPFARFERLQSGDLVVVRTSDGFYSYQLFANQKILDNETWVLDAIPEGVVAEATELITLTTCDPRWNSTRRWAWWGKLVSFSTQSPEVLSR